MIVPGGEVGGAEAVLLSLIQRLDRMRFDPVVLCFSRGSFTERLAALGVEAEVLPLSNRARSLSRWSRTTAGGWLLALPGFIRPLLRVAKTVRARRVRVIHTHGLKPHIIGSGAAALTGVPLVWHMHDFVPAGAARAVMQLGAWMFPKTIVAVSAAVAGQFGATVRRAKVVRVHNGIDPVEYSTSVAPGAFRSEYGVPADDCVVALVAHLTRWKGHDQFIRAAARLLSERRDVWFFIVGGPIYSTNGHVGYRDELIQLCTRLHVTDRVILTGYRSDIPRVLKDANIVAHTSTHAEPFGRVLVEAMAMERPIVATSVGAVPEIVIDGVTGLLVPPGDPVTLATAISRLAADPGLARRLGVNGRQRVTEHFTLERQVCAVEDLYESLLGTDLAPASSSQRQSGSRLR